MLESPQHLVLAGIIQCRESQDGLDRYLYAKAKLTDDHFNPYEKICWKFITSLLTATGYIPGFEIVNHYLPTTKLSIEVQAEVRTLWLSLENAETVNPADFNYGVFQCHEECKRRLLAEALTTSGEVLAFGKEIKRNHYEGYEDSRRLLEDKLLKIDGLEHESMPEGNIRDEREQLLDAYQTSDLVRLPTGIAPLDNLIGGGVSPGQLIMMCGYTAEGKSMALVNIAHHMAISGYNVVYITTETLYPVVSLRAVVRHSRLPKFGIPGGLSYKAIDTNTLLPDQFAAYERVVDDWTGDNNYGRFQLFQVGSDTTIPFLKSKLRAYQSIFNVDAVFIDELQMLSAGKDREKSRDELNTIIRAAKQLSVDFDGGRGVPVFTPWQMSRNAWEAAKLNGGRYTRASLSETSEAERRSDTIISIFRMPDSDHRLTAQILKNRTGAAGEFEMHADYDRCYMGSSYEYQSSSEDDLRFFDD